MATTTLDEPARPPAEAPRSVVLRPGGRRIRLLTVVGVCVALAAALMFILPLIWMLAASFKPEADIVSFPPALLPRSFTLEHYTDVWQRIDFPRLFANTLLFAGAVTASSLVLDSLAAYALARLEFPGRDVLFILIIVTLMVPGQVTLIPVFNMLSDLGWVNTYQGLIMPRAADAFGIFFLRQYFLALPRELEDAGRIDGASEPRIYRSLILPLTRPALLTLGLFLFMFNWNDLLWPLIVSTDAAMQTLPAGLASFMGQHVVEYGVLTAGSVLAMIPMVIAFVAVQRSFVQSAAMTGLK